MSLNNSCLKYFAFIPFAFIRPVCELNGNWTPQWGNVVGYWNLNGALNGTIASNDTVTATVGPNGTAKNAGATYVGAKMGPKDASGISYTGLSYTTMGNPTSLNGNGLSQGTLMVWLKPNVPALAAQTVMGKDLSYKLQVNDKTGDLSYPSGGTTVTLLISTNGLVWNCSVSTVAILPVSQWVHVAATWDQTTPLKIYFNGVSQTLGSSCNLGSAGAPANTVFNFQLATGGVLDSYTGQMDEPAVFSKSLAQTEIEAIYQRQRNCNY